MQSMWKAQIRELAARSGIGSLDELAARVGYDRSYLSRVFNRKSPLTDEVAERVADVLDGVEPWDLKPDYGGLSDTERRLIKAYRAVPPSERGRVFRSLLALLDVERDERAA